MVKDLVYVEGSRRNEAKEVEITERKEGRRDKKEDFKERELQTTQLGRTKY